MAKLTTAKRNALPKSQFAGPDRTYPDDTKARAIDAKGRATQQVAKGNLSPGAAKKIDAKANKVIGRGARGR